MTYVVEVWKDVPGYEGLYQVSDLGRVRSLPRVVVRSDGIRRRFPGLVLKPGRQASGHLHVHLCDTPGRRRQARVHQLVLDAFVGPCPEGMEGCHNDGDPTNNRLDNLRWDTPKANAADKKRHGTYLSGERVPWAKLTEPRVTEAHQLRAAGWPCSAIAARFGVSRRAVGMALSGHTWKDVMRQWREGSR